MGTIASSSLAEAAPARTVNTRGLLATASYSVGTTDLSNRSLTWDEHGNLESIADSISGSAGCAEYDTVFCAAFDGIPPLAGSDPRIYTYDTLDRLTDMVSGYGTETFTYDPLGIVRNRSFTPTTSIISDTTFEEWQVVLVAYGQNSVAGMQVDCPLARISHQGSSRAGSSVCPTWVSRPSGAQA